MSFTEFTGVTCSDSVSHNWVTTVDSIKYVIRSSVKVPEFDKHQKMTGGHIGRNVVEKSNKDEDSCPKTRNDKTIKLRLRKLDY